MAAAVFTGEWPCSCLNQERRDQGTPPEERRSPRTYAWRVANGCDETAPRPVGRLDGVAQMRCLRAVVQERQPDAWDLIRLSLYAEKGALPEEGGVMNQAAPVLDAIDLLQRAIERGRAEVRENGQTPGPTYTPKGRRAPNPVKSSLKPLRKV